LRSKIPKPTPKGYIHPILNYDERQRNRSRLKISKEKPPMGKPMINKNSRRIAKRIGK